MSGSAVAGRSAGGPAGGAAGMTLIEASAGTGKTRELTGIVARLVVEAHRRLDEILVVTFTRAATAELRDRIREALRSTRRAVETGEAEEGSQAEELRVLWTQEAGFDPEAAARRLGSALEDIDRANVFTIHGFCQRVLADLAFDGGFPFGFEVSGDDGDLVAHAARDFWRRRMYAASRVLAGYAVDNGFRPDDLGAWVRRWRGKPDIRIEGGELPDTPIEVRETAWRAVLGEVRVAWEAHRETFLAEVRNGSWLNRGKYRARRTESELAAITALLADPDPLLPEAELFGRYGATALAAACKRGHALPENPLFAALEGLEEASAELRAAFDAWLRWARREVLAEAGESIRRRALEDRRLGYDDLLLELNRALRSEGGESLARRIRRDYPVALIDEFQDTDPVQAEVFLRIYCLTGGLTGDAPGAVTDGDPGEEPEEGAGAAIPGDAEGPAPREPAGNEGPAGMPLARARGAASGTESTPGRAGAGRLFVVGDPKQSIYRFRGADVFAYLRARAAAGESRSLDRNWRSVPALVEAVNAVFAGSNPFVVPEIPCPPVNPGREEGEPLSIEGTVGERPLGFRLLPARRDGKRWPKGEAVPFAASAAADEAARLLALAEEGGATIEGRPLTGSDIAVLVRTGDQGRLVADALRERNVRSVEVGDESVFKSREAEQMERLLWALAEPGREARERGALAGDLFGLDAGGLLALEENEDAWSDWSERLRGWRADWEARGIGPLLRRLVEAEGGAARLLRYRDGARRLTNVRHLADLLQAAEAERRTAPAGLALWFSRRRAEEGTRDEDLQLRLESDEELVRVLTVHGAKGLEFPVVFLPFAWYARDPFRGGEDHAAYHEGEAEGYGEVLDLEPDETARARARREELSEDLRLLYVALTRAKYRCVVTWGQVRDAEHAPLGWLLHRVEGGEGDGDGGPSPAEEDGSDGEGSDSVDAAVAATTARFAGLTDQALHAEVRAFAASCPDSVSVAELAAGEPLRPTVLAAPPAVPLASRTLDRLLPRTRQLTSFSALTAPDGVHGAPAAPPEVDRPDHDQHEAAEPAGEAASPVEDDALRVAPSFPRGPVAGSCLHRIFERLDEAPGEAPEEGPDLDAICRDALAEFGFPGDLQEAARGMVERARSVRLKEARGAATGSPAGPGRESGGGFRLADPLPRLVELEFAFPVAGLERGRLATRLREGGYPDPFPPSPAGRPDEPPPRPIGGFLRGFVDLVVEHGGRWYVIDYKSNWLGPSPADYAREAVAAAMGSSAYPLQYLLYLVALHRYLDLKLPGYDYDRHVGGVFYLFVRGMDPAAGMERGVWFDRPSASFVHGLDRLFRGGAA